MLSPLADGVWTAAQPLKAAGFNLGSRMTIAAMADGGLWVISPIALGPELLAEVQALGPVRHLVSPNLLHHLSLAAWKEAFPEARIWGDSALTKKQPELPVEDLGDAVPEPMAKDFEMVNVRGMPILRERVFLHPASGTLIQTDFLFNISDAGWYTNTYLSLCGIRGKPGSSWLLKMGVKDKAAVRGAMAAVAEWDFQHLGVGHGEPVSTDAKDRFVDGMKWLLG